MSGKGIRDGDEVVVVIYRNKESVGEIIIDAISDQEISAGVYTDDGDTLLVMHEALKAAQSCVNFHLQKPRLKKIIDERVEELKELIAREEEDNPPSPADGELPF